MYNLLKIEFMKLKKSKEFHYIFLVICIISIGLMFNKVYCMEVFIRKSNPEYVISGLNCFREMVRGKLYIEILQNILLIIFICRDFEKRIAHSEELAGYSRFEILVSKVIICFIIKAILTFSFVFIGTIGISIIYKLGQDLTLNLVLKIIRMYLLSLLISFGISTTAIMISYLFKIMSISVLVWIGITFGYLTGATVLEDVFHSTQSLQYFFNHSIFTFYKKLEVDMLAGDITYITLMSLLRIAIIIFLTYMIFRRTELK